MDGWVIIGTELDTKQLDRDIKEAEKKLKGYEKEGEALTKKKLKLELDISEAEKNLDLLEYQLRSTYEKLQKEQKKLDSFSDWQKDTPAYDKQLQKVQQIQMEYEKLVTKEEIAVQKIEAQDKELEETNLKIKANAENQELLNTKIDEMKQKLTQANGAGGFEKINGSIKSAGNSMKDILKKVAKWSLALFGIRTAYSLIRKAVSTVSQYNDQIKTDLEYINFAIAKTLEPVIKVIINLVFRLLQAINSVVYSITGFNMFANASADAFKKTNKQANALRKTLAGFDEMNVLGDNVSSSGSAATTPSFNLADLVDLDMNKLINLITDNLTKAFNKIKANVKKVLGDLGFSDGFIKGWEKTFDGIKDMIVGFTRTLGGLLEIIVGLVTGNSELVKQGVQNVIDGIKQILWGLLEFIVGTFLEGIALLVDMFGEAGKAILGLIWPALDLEEALYGDYTQTVDLTNAEEDLQKAIDNVIKTENLYVNALERADKAQEKLTEAEKEAGMKGEELYKLVSDGTLIWDKMTGAQKELYKAYVNNETAQSNLKTLTEQFNKVKEEEAKKAELNQIKLHLEAGEYDKYRDAVMKAYDDGTISAEEARDLIGQAMKDMSDDAKAAFTKDIPNDIKNGLDIKKYKSEMNSFKKGFNDFLGGLGGVINVGIKAVTGGFAKGGVSGFAQGGVVKMATGSIISQPGRGVPMSRAIGGEAGREGILPLTNSQMMAELGRSIGEWVTVNLTNITKIDNRQLAKEQKNINARNDFLTNS